MPLAKYERGVLRKALDYVKDAVDLSPDSRCSCSLEAKRGLKMYLETWVLGFLEALAKCDEIQEDPEATVAEKAAARLALKKMSR